MPEKGNSTKIDSFNLHLLVINTKKYVEEEIDVKK